MLLGMAAVMYPVAVPHAAHHAHHQATTHGSVLCTWLCSAGQSTESPLMPVQAVLVAMPAPDAPLVAPQDSTRPLFVPSRAPPSLFA